MAFSGFLAVLILLGTLSTDTSDSAMLAPEASTESIPAKPIGYLGCWDFKRFDRSIELVNPGFYSPDSITAEGCAQACWYEHYSHYGLRERNKLCFCGSLDNGTDPLSVCGVDCYTVPHTECVEDTNRMSIYVAQTSAPSVSANTSAPSVWIQELEPGAATFSSDKAIFRDVVFPQGYFPPWEDLTFTVGLDLNGSSHESVTYRIDFGDGTHNSEGSAFYYGYLSTGSYQVVISALSVDKKTIASKSYDIKISLPLSLYSRNVVTVNCPKDAAENDTLSCEATVPSGTGLSASVSFGSEVMVQPFTFSDTKSSYVGLSWKSDTPFSDINGESVPTEYMKIWEPVEDARSLLVACDIEITQPGNVNFVVRKKVEAEVDDCEILEESDLAEEDYESDTSGGIQCVEPKRYSFTKRSCVHVSHPEMPQLELSWERLTFPQTFGNAGTHRVFFNEPIWLNKGDILGVQIFESAVAKVASSETPDCALPSGSSTCSYSGVETCVKFITLRSSRVMALKSPPPSLEQQTLNTVWVFQSDLDTTTAEDTFEYLLPVTNVNVTGQETALVSEDYVYQVSFEGKADIIFWSFGDGEEMKTSKCELEVTKRWWRVGDFNLTVTVSNKASPITFTLPVRVGMLPHVHFFEWDTVVARGEVAAMPFRNGYFSKEGKFIESYDAEFMTCYVSTSVYGSTILDMKSVDDDDVWVPTTNLWGQYIKYFFDDSVYLSAVLTKGHIDIDEWVEEFHLFYHVKGDDWYPLLQLDGSDIFYGNFDHNTVVKNTFATVYTDGIRLEPITWHKNIAMRWEVVGEYQSGIIEELFIGGESAGLFVSDDDSEDFLEEYPIWEATLRNISFSKNGQSGNVSCYANEAAHSWIEITASNHWGEVTKGTNLYIQDPIIISQSMLSKHVFSSSENVTLNLTLDSGDFVSVNVVILDGDDVLSACEDWMVGRRQIFCNFQSGVVLRAMANHTVIVELENAISGIVHLEETFIVIEEVRGLSLSVSSTEVDVGEPVTFTYELLQGTNVTVTVSGLEDALEFYHACASCGSTVHTFDFQFTRTENKTVVIKAENFLETLTDSTHVHVVGNVRNVMLSYDDLLVKDPLEHHATAVLNFTFDGLDLEIPHNVIIRCDFNAGLTTSANLLVFEPHYSMYVYLDKAERREFTCEVENPTSLKNFEGTIEIEEPISGLSLVIDTLNITMLESVFINVSVETGSRIYYEVFFGDGESVEFDVMNSLTNVEHVYRQWGTFVVWVRARNELGFSGPVDQTVIVSTPSEGCVLFMDDYYVPLPAGEDHASFEIDLFVPHNLPVPNLAEYNLYFNNSFFLGGFLDPPLSDPKDSETLRWVTSFEVQSTSTGLAHFVVDIEKSTERYFQTCFWDAFIIEEVSGITSKISYAPSAESRGGAVGNSSWLLAPINPFGSRPVIQISSPVTIEIAIPFGSSLSVVWSFELMDSEDSTCEAGQEEVRVCEFLFHNDRDFTFSVNVTNPVSTMGIEQDISIFKPVGSVTIEGPVYVVRVYQNIPFLIIIDSLGSESCYKLLIKSSFEDVDVEAYYGEPLICEMLFPEWTSGSQTFEELDDFVKTVDESGTTFQFVHNFTVPSTYQLEVIGKNLISEVNKIYHQRVLEPACYKPYVSVAKENQCDRSSDCNFDNSTKLFAASDVVTILSKVRLNCSSSYLAIYKWRVFLILAEGAEEEYLLPDNVVTSGLTLGTLTIPPATLRYGSYRIELNVTMEGADDATNGDWTYIEIDSSPLIAKINGGDYRTIPWRSITILDGITNSYDPDVGREDKTGLTFHWLCRRKTYHRFDGPPIENVETFETWSYDFSHKLAEGTVNPEFTKLTTLDVGGCFGRYGDEDAPSPGGLLNTNDGKLEVNTSSMFDNMEYEFQLIVTSDSFQRAEAYQTWHVLSADIPSVAIECVQNCGSRVNPTNRFALQGYLNATSQFIPHFKWEIRQLVDDGLEEIQETFWGNFSTTGSSSPTVTFLPGVLQEGESYIISMYSSFTVDFYRKAFATYQIFVNSPPQPAPCEVSAYEGTALLDEFLVSCEDWTDVDTPLTYTFRTKAEGTPDSDWKVIHSSPKAKMEHATTLPAGLEEHGYNVEIQISVHDRLGSYTIYSMIIIKVTPGPSADSNEAAEVVDSLTDDLVENAANGDIGVAANIAINIVEVLNTKSASDADAAANTDSGSTDTDTSQTNEDEGPLDLNTRISIRTEVVGWIAETENPTVEAIDQGATVLAGAIQVPEEVTLETQEKAVDVAVHYSNTLLSLSKVESTVDNALRAATNRVLQLANNVVSSAMLKLNNTIVTIEEAKAFNIYEEDFNEALIEPEEKNKDVLEEAETAKSKANFDIDKALSVVDDIQGIMQQALVPDEGPSKVQAEGITVTCSKARPLSNETEEIKTEINENCSVTLPHIDLLKKDGFNVSIATVWVVETALFNFNIKPEDEVANMNGQSLSVKMRDHDSGEELQMKNLTDSFHLTIPQREESIQLNTELMQIYTNESNPKGAAIAVHTLYVPWSNALTLEFEAGAFEEMELDVVYNFTFHILLKQKDAPNFYDFDVECLLQQQLWLTEEPPKNRKRTHKFKVASRGEKECFFDNDELDILRDGNTSAVNFRVGVLHTFVASIPEQETEEAARKLSFTSIRYTLRPRLSKCYFSSEEAKSWKSVGCKVLPTSSISQTDCACNHLTVFGGGFQVPINKIDLSDSAFTKLDENPVVFTFLLACLCLYAVIIVWARKKDMRDLEKTGVTPLPDNDPRDKFMYEVTVYTGFKGNSGTTANISINISGDKAETGPRPFVDPKRKVFQQGGIDAFLLATPRALGELQFLRVWHDNSGNDASWFLSRVSVKDLKTEKVYYFIVDQWLAVEEDDGKIDRVCPVAGKSELTAFGFLFYSKSRKNLSDGHLWFSIFARPYKSNFTRVQRATCCLSLLFTTMMANIFFYNVELVGGNQTELFKLGPITLTVGEVIIGCISSLMVFPINLIIVNIFRSVKPPPKDHGIIRWIKRKLRMKKVSSLNIKENFVPASRAVSTASINPLIYSDTSLAEQELERERDRLDGAVKSPPYSISGRLNDPNPDDVLGGDHRLEYEPVAGFKRSGRKRRKKRFMLPWYFVYLGWFLVVATVFASFFLTVEVAGQFGKEKSMEWLLSIGVSLVQDIFLSQPIKVLLLALFFSLIIKKPEEEDLSNDERTISQLRDDEEYMHERMTLEELNNPSKLAYLSDIKRKRITMTDLPTYDDLEQSRTLRLKEIKMRKVLMEIIFYIIFLNVIIIISFGDRDFNSFWMNRSMQNMFVDAKYHGRMKFTMVRNRTGFWNWTDHTLIPSLYSLSWYNGDPDLPGRSQHQVADQTMSLIGSPRFRQLRVLRDYCSVPSAMQKSLDECKDIYSIAGNDAGIYNESWANPLTDTSNLNLKSYPQSVWTYQDWISLQSIPYPGYHGVYAGGGYIAELGKTPRESWRVTRYLKEKKWVDQYTRAVFIEFVVYNPSVNLFCASFLIMEFLPQGGATGYVYFIPMKLDRYHSSIAYFILAGEIVYVCFILYFMVREVSNIRREKSAYFKSIWNLLEILTIIMAILGLICYFYQLFLSRDLLAQYREKPKRFLNFQYVSTWTEFHSWFLSGVLFIATLKFLRLLRFNRRLQLLAFTLKGSGKEIVAYTIVFGIVFMAYASAAYLLFSVGLADFSTIIRTVESLFSTILGKFDFHGMRTYQRFFGPLFFFTFVMLMIFILMSMFLSIINAAFRKVREENEMEENELEMVNFIMSRFLSWTGFSQKRMKNKSRHKSRYIDGVDPVDIECEEMKIKLNAMVFHLQRFVVQERRQAFGPRGDEGKARQIFFT